MIYDKKKILRWGLLLLWMGFIFYMSNQPAKVSSQQSDLIVNAIGINTNSSYNSLATFITRKGAHMTEYFILFLLWYRVLVLYVDSKKAKLYAIGLIFLYACSDELHQYFVPGRSAKFKDVMIDTSGGLIGLLVTNIYESINAKIKIKREYLDE